MIVHLYSSNIAIVLLIKQHYNVMSQASVTLDLHLIKSNTGHQSVALTSNGPTVAGLLVLRSGGVLGRTSLSQQAVLQSRERLQQLVFLQRLDEHGLVPQLNQSSLCTRQSQTSHTHDEGQCGTSVMSSVVPPSSSLVCLWCNGRDVIYHLTMTHFMMSSCA